MRKNFDDIYVHKHTRARIKYFKTASHVSIWTDEIGDHVKAGMEAAKGKNTRTTVEKLRENN